MYNYLKVHCVLTVNYKRIDMPKTKYIYSYRYEMRDMFYLESFVLHGNLNFCIKTAFHVYHKDILVVLVYEKLKKKIGKGKNKEVKMGIVGPQEHTG